MDLFLHQIRHLLYFHDVVSNNLPSTYIIQTKRPKKSAMDNLFYEENCQIVRWITFPYFKFPTFFFKINFVLKILSFAKTLQFLQKLRVYH